MTAPDLAALRSGDRRALAKAITLIESTREADRAPADALLTAALPHSGRALRLGVSGVPGVGKSTFIEALGTMLIERGHRVAVLAVDPSSTLSGGSVLGDKTRMERLSVNPAAFIRPSPSGGTLGGVAERTREVMTLCEAAGYDVVVVETVGVGQSETAVAGMTDVFLLLQLPNAGDDLQAIKRGVLELADFVVVNKADLDRDAAARAAMQIESGMRRHDAVRVISALRGEGLDALWAEIDRFADERTRSGARDARRRDQAVTWMWDAIRTRLLADFRADGRVDGALPAILADVQDGRLPASTAARRLLDLFERRI